MDALFAAIASSLLTVLGTGLLQVRREARRLETEKKLELRNALGEFGAALDAVILELRQLPRRQRRVLAAWGWVERTLPGLDFLVARVGRLLFGRQFFEAIDRLQRATNELMLIAPPPVVEGLTPIFDRFSSFADRDEDWFECLQQERSDFAAVSRSLVLSPTSEGDD